MKLLLTFAMASMIYARLQRFVRRALWNMDVHPSARIAATALIDRTYPKGIHIEENVVIGEEAVVLSHDMARGLYLDTRIGAGTTLGPRVIVMPGVKIGRNCVIAAGAVVNRDLPDEVRAIGNPARIVEHGGPGDDGRVAA